MKMVNTESYISSMFQQIDDLFYRPKFLEVFSNEMGRLFVWRVLLSQPLFFGVQPIGPAERAFRGKATTLFLVVVIVLGLLRALSVFCAASGLLMYDR